MTDAPTAYPPPQIVITYSGGRYWIDVAGKADRHDTANINALGAFVARWADDARTEAAQ